MERNFLSLGSKNVAMALKDDFLDNSKNSGMQWSFSNKVSAVPQLLSFKAAQDEKQRKTVTDPILSNTETPNLTHRNYVKNVASEKKGGNQYAMTAYPFQISDAHSAHRSQEVKLFPISNQPKNAHHLALNVPVLQSQLVSSVKPVIGSSMNLVQPFGGVPIATSVSVLPSTCSSIVGSTDLRNASKPPGVSTQLTIFYAGSVCVYNDISPEKAQAIMLLAGSGPPQTQNNMLSTGQVQASFPSDGFKGVPLLGLSSPLSATHLMGSHAGAGFNGDSELPTSKPIQTSVSHANLSEPPKAANAGSMTTFIPAAVPQARKASLARFLEKRKERINISPYSTAKKTPDCASTTLDLMA